MKKTALACLLAGSLFVSGCLGPNNLFNGLNNWNGRATEMNWLNEGIFLAFVIIPVYGFAWLGDVVIFNTIGYWGSNPIDDPGAFPESFSSGGGGE